MAATIKKMPVGIQDFEYLRTSGFLYVDKTNYIYNLATFGKPYFLGRPRRFGKSLFLSTLKAYFEGKKELFDGLALADLEKDWIKYPVIYLDFNAASYDSVDTLNAVLNNVLATHEEKWGFEKGTELNSIRFKNLIQKTVQKFGQRVVVLVDEYDKSLINTMNSPKLNEEICMILKGFYGVLKAEDANLRFVFLTGVTKFSKISIFSDLNQLADISMDNNFAGICGISETELKANFQPELHALAKEAGQTYEEVLAEMKKRYDGYHFAKVSEDMYNPFSVLNTFAKLDFSNYWYQTGTPTFLVKILKDIHFDIRKFANNEVSATADFLTDYRVDNPDPIPVLYQSGYLTIKDYNSVFNKYILGFPNEEVKYGFLRNLLPAYAPTDSFTMNSFFAGDFAENLWNGNVEGFMTQAQAFFASIPYDVVDNERKDEKHYQLIFYLLFTLMGQFTSSEVKSANGRADAVVKTPTGIFVFEFKMDGSATAEDALKQIDDKGYLLPCTVDHRKLVKIGVEFSIAERGIKRWLIG